ncbi:MAG: hypothetical protein AAGB46_09510 [Verrucomicrobiota bacterium]
MSESSPQNEDEKHAYAVTRKLFYITLAGTAAFVAAFTIAWYF